MRLLAFILLSTVLSGSAAVSPWREASEAELKEVIPARAPVEKERIETEMRTASGITDGKGKFIAGVVLITAGYSADGKYSHFFVTQAPLRVGSLPLPPGEYVFGWHKNDQSLTVKFYDAHSGAALGTVEAARTSRIGRIEQFHIYPPGDRALIQVGRFGMPYTLE